MAEVGSLAAIIQLTTTALKLARALHRFSKDAGAAKAEVTRFANQVQSFSNTIEAAESILSSYCRKNPKSPLVIFIQRQVLPNIHSEATTVRDNLQAIKHRVDRMMSRLSLWANIQWSFKKSSILELFPEMESVKTTLTLLMTTTTLEAALRSGDTDHNEIRRLKGAIKHHLKTIRDLRLQVAYLAPRSHGAGSYQSTPYPMAQDPLMELGRSMYEHGLVPVPDSPPTSPSNPEDSLQTRKISSTPPNPPQNGRGAAARHSIAPQSDTGSSGPHMPAPPLRRVHARQPPLSLEAASNMPTNYTGYPGNKPQTPGKTLRFKDEDVGETISGWVETAVGVPRQTTATVSRALNGNIISMNKAKELDLEILEPDEDVFFRFGNGYRPEKSAGRVVVRWNRSDYAYSQALYPPITVTCDVCENSKIGLVFGRPFSDGRARRWDKFSG